jgi:hypothetical protein
VSRQHPTAFQQEVLNRAEKFIVRPKFGEEKEIVRDQFEQLLTVGKDVKADWIGQIVGRKLGLKTERHRAGYAIALSEGAKLVRLFEKYGIASEPVNFVNSDGEVEETSDRQEPLII